MRIYGRHNMISQPLDILFYDAAYFCDWVVLRPTPFDCGSIDIGLFERVYIYTGGHFGDLPHALHQMNGEIYHLNYALRIAREGENPVALIDYTEGAIIILDGTFIDWATEAGIVLPDPHNGFIIVTEPNDMMLIKMRWQ